MICAIMQPTYLSWPGYFHIMQRADKFVFLDDVQFARRSWQSRNCILLNEHKKWLTVPVRKTARSALVREIQIDYSTKWQADHMRFLSEAYSRLPYGREVIELVKLEVEKSPPRLVELACSLISAIARYIGVHTSTVMASDLVCGGARSEHLAQICKMVGATSYLSPIGSAEYLLKDEFELRSGIPLEFSQFYSHPYEQAGTRKFVDHLSIVDVIANIGPTATLRYISEIHTSHNGKGRDE